MTQPVGPPLPDDPELAAYLEAQAREYGTYVATSRIYAGSALAYEVGHPVPIDNVRRHGYLLNGQVALVDGAEHPEGMKLPDDDQPTAKKHTVATKSPSDQSGADQSGADQSADAQKGDPA